MNVDVISLGEPLLRLSPPLRGQLRRATQFDARVVGSQLNVAANLARLGRRAAFVTNLPDGPLGQLALDAIRSYGVDMSAVRLVPDSRLGVTYVEFSAAPRPPVAVYDRAHSAASTIAAASFNWDALLAGARAAYTDGIFPGLGDGCRAATAAFLAAARRHGALVAFDANYREHLWTADTARAAWSELLPLVDVAIVNPDVCRQVFGLAGNDADLGRQLAEQFTIRTVCLTVRGQVGLARGSWRSLAWHAGQAHEGHEQSFEIVDRYGTGDAFTAGLLHRLLDRRDDIAAALDFGNALCALAHTIEGDVAHVTAADVEALLRDGPDVRLRR
jgi:2-dehydro-3-deoxygluconokinase